MRDLGVRLKSASMMPAKKSTPLANPPSFQKGVTATPMQKSTAPAMTLTATSSPQPVYNTVVVNISYAAPVSQSTSCEGLGLADGQAFCHDEPGASSYVIFCNQGAGYALDCSTFVENGQPAVCGVADGSIDCVLGPTTKVDTTLLVYQTDAVEAQLACAPEEEDTAECDGDYLLYCTGGGVWELDCTTFDDGNGNHATCGALDNGYITCGFDD
jgi:hypothetical protein